MTRAQREQPRLHRLVRDIVPRFDFRKAAANGLDLLLLFLDVDLDCVGNKIVRTSSCGLRQPLELALDFRSQTNTHRGGSCVSHAHKLARSLRIVTPFPEPAEVSPATLAAGRARFRV